MTSISDNFRYIFSRCNIPFSLAAACLTYRSKLRCIYTNLRWDILFNKDTLVKRFYLSLNSISVTPPINDMNYQNYGGDSGRFSSGSLSFPSAPTRSMGSFDGITGRSRLLEDFRNNRLQNPQLRELVNHMFEFSQGTVLNMLLDL